MREIKFRAWDRDQMFENVAVVDGKPLRRTYFATDIYGPFWQKSTLMQYTGLKDKNGKEIYEGDILEFDAEEWGSPDEKDRRWAVEWDAVDGCWQTGGGTTSECSAWKEVIGNIHENPELIE